MAKHVIQHMKFNASQDCFVCGLDTGLRVYNSDPLQEKRNLGINVVGSIKLCSMLHRTNLIAIVGGGPDAKFAENAVLVWDDSRQDFVLELTFPMPVLNVLMSHSRLIVILFRRVYIFSFPTPCIRQCTFETRENISGIAQLSADPQNEILIFPGHKTGSVQIVDLKHLGRGTSMAPITINAHQTEIGCLALNAEGTLMATGSVLGTVIRVFDTRNRLLLSEFRRGSDPATLYGIRFSPDSAFLCVSSDKGTVHVFAVKDKQSNRKSLLQQVGIVTEEAQRSLAQFSLPTESPCICGFGQGQSIIALCLDGTYHKFVFTLDGNCNRDGFDHFLEFGDDEDFWKIAS